ncbi:MAG: hypothetical protein ACYCST_07875 [Acidimicrobiales bacterium]
MSRRSNAQAWARWSEDTREQARATGRNLAMDLYHRRETDVRPYGVGLVLAPFERMWAEVLVQFNLDLVPPVRPNGPVAPPAISTWLVTSDRVVGRLSDDRLHGYRWETVVGARVDLATGREAVTLDIENEPTLIWSGPGVAPMAVAAVFHLYGPVAMIEHPGLIPLRLPSGDPGYGGTYAGDG